MGPIENKVQHPQALVDSAPGHQETLKPTSGGFSLFAMSALGRSLPAILNLG